MGGWGAGRLAGQVQGFTLAGWLGGWARGLKVARLMGGPGLAGWQAGGDGRIPYTLVSSVYLHVTALGMCPICLPDMLARYAAAA